MNLNELFKIRPTNEKENDYIATVGQHLATERHFKTREEAEKYINTPQWDTIIAVVAEMFEIHTVNEHKIDKK